MEIYNVLVKGKGLKTIYGLTVYQWLGGIVLSGLGLFLAWSGIWLLYAVFGY